MPGHARRDIVRPGQIAVYHTWSRCVQRAFLCGEDPVTGNNFDHRRLWIKTLLEYQASVFAVEVGNYTILANHQHAILRTRPDVAATWPDEQVAWRWKLAWPRWEDGQWVCHPSDQEIEELLNHPERIPQLRENLSSLSWFMARWKEPIARLANAESQTKGHFYEQRFGSRELVDEGAVLCCSVYVDVNQIKAGMADSLEGSRYAAIHDRLQAWRRREAEESVRKFGAGQAEGYALDISQVEELLADCFLAPIGDQGPLLLLDSADAARLPAASLIVQDAESAPPQAESANNQAEPVEKEKEGPQDNSSRVEGAPGEPSHQGATCTPGTSAVGRRKSRRSPQRTTKIHERLQLQRRRRASDHVFLAMAPEQYLQVVQWTASQVVSGATHPPPGELEAVLRRWSVKSSSWPAVVEHFASWFHHAVGRVENLTRRMALSGRRWIQGIRHCRDVFT